MSENIDPRCYDRGNAHTATDKTGILAGILLLFLCTLMLAGMMPAAAETGQEPVTVVTAFADDAVRRMVDSISEVNIRLSVPDDTVVSYALNYRKAMEDAAFDRNLYIIDSAEPFRLSDKELPGEQTARALISSLNNQVYGSGDMNALQAASAIRATGSGTCLNSGGYHSDDTCYLVETVIAGKTRAVTVCWFNEYDAILSGTIPIVADAAVNVPSSLDRLSLDYEMVAVPDLSGGEIEGILSEMRNTPIPKRQLEDIVRDLTAKIGARADGEYLKSVNAGNETALCMSCKVFQNEPDRILRWDLSGVTRDLFETIFGQDLSMYPDSEIQALLRICLTACLFTDATDITSVCAASIMQVNTFVPGLEKEDSVCWLCYDDGDDIPLVCAVSVHSGGVSALPVLNRELVGKIIINAKGGVLDAAECLPLFF